MGQESQNNYSWVDRSRNCRTCNTFTLEHTRADDIIARDKDRDGGIIMACDIFDIILFLDTAQMGYPAHILAKCYAFCVWLFSVSSFYRITCKARAPFGLAFAIRDPLQASAKNGLKLKQLDDRTCSSGARANTRTSQ